MQFAHTVSHLRLCFVAPKFFRNYPYPHHHLFYELGLVFSGSCSWIVHGKREEHLTVGDFILVSPHTNHWEECRKGERPSIGWVGFSVDSPLEKVLPKDFFNCCKTIPTIGNKLAEIVSSIHEENSNGRWGNEELIQLYLKQMLLLFQRAYDDSRVKKRLKKQAPPNRQQQIATNAAFYLNNNLEKTINVSQVARYFSLSTSHFSALFRKHHRISPKKFLHQARMKKARNLLLHSTTSVKEIASICGYVDAAHFCRKFKNHTRFTPSKFRQRN
jgi:AraC-like DNA-binding protein